MYYFIMNKYFGRKEIFFPPDVNKWKSDYCEHCGGNHLSSNEPIKFEIKGDPCDFYMYCGFLLVSQKFLDLLKEWNLTGYTVKKATVIGWDKAQTESDFKDFVYYELIITGRCGFMMDLQSNILPKCDFCGRNLPMEDTVIGLSFNNQKYDKSDIFAFDNLTNIPIVDENLKKKLSKAKLTNLSFIKLSEMDM